MNPGRSDLGSDDGRPEPMGGGLHAIVLIPIALLVLASAAFFGLGARRMRPYGPPFPLQNAAPALSRAKIGLPAPQGDEHQRFPGG